MSDDETTLVEPVGSHDHIQGDVSASVTLVEYGDYECPYCGETYGVLKEVLQKMGTVLRFVFRNFPLREMHPYALKAAEAAEGDDHRPALGSTVGTVFGSDIDNLGFVVLGQWRRRDWLGQGSNTSLANLCKDA